MSTHRDLPVVVTRPARQAVPLATRIEAAGRRAVVFPLLEIQPLPDQGMLRERLGHLAEFAMVAFVSPNAIEHTFACIECWPPLVAIAVVGEGSKAALARHGLTADNATIFFPRNRERTDSETLLEVLDLDALRGRRVLIVRGESGRELLSDALRAGGVEVEQLAAYRRTAPVLDDARRAQLHALLEGGAEWLVTSSEALRNLVDLAGQAGGDDAVSNLQQQRLIVPHLRIAETAEALGFAHVLRTGSGDEQLIAALQFRP